MIVSNAHNLNNFIYLSNLVIDILQKKDLSFSFQSKYNMEMKVNKSIIVIFYKFITDNENILFTIIKVMS